MKKWGLLGLLAVCAIGAKTQNNYLFSHYMFNPAYFNPGWIGSERQAYAAFQHRSQWLGYETSFDGPGGSPSTQLLTAMAPFQNFLISSVGITISNDNLGPVANLQVQLPVAYSMEFRNGTLSLGLAPGIFSQTLKFDEFRFNDPTDPLNHGSREVQTKPDLSAGVFYQARNSLFVGVGAANILRPGFDFGIDSLENFQKTSFALHGGYTLHVNDNLDLSPTVLVRSDLAGYTFDVGAIATFNKKMWAGFSYRMEEAVIFYLGYSLLPDNKLKVGYAFDYVINGQRGKAATSHEIFIRYDLPDLVFGGKKAVKTPRFSF